MERKLLRNKKRLSVVLMLASALLGLGMPPANAGTRLWGYVGCSNTHDAFYGYHRTPGAMSRFWPWADYRIEGATVHNWLTNDRYFAEFEEEVQTYDAGLDPPLIFVQPCAQIDPSSSGYWPLDFTELNSLIDQIQARHPSSILYVGPLQDYYPIDLCSWMGRGGKEIPIFREWLSELVAIGKVLAGPGVDGNPSLGPLARNGTVWIDDCHPTGDPSHPTPWKGSGVELLGRQLAAFFDAL